MEIGCPIVDDPREKIAEEAQTEDTRYDGSW